LEEDEEKDELEDELYEINSNNHGIA